MKIFIYLYFLLGFVKTYEHQWSKRLYTDCQPFNFMCQCPRYSDGCYTCPPQCSQGVGTQYGQFHPGVNPGSGSIEAGRHTASGPSSTVVMPSGVSMTNETLLLNGTSSSGGIPSNNSGETFSQYSKCPPNPMTDPNISWNKCHIDRSGCLVCGEQAKTPSISSPEPTATMLNIDSMTTQRTKITNQTKPTSLKITIEQTTTTDTTTDSKKTFQPAAIANQLSPAEVTQKVTSVMAVTSGKQRTTTMNATKHVKSTTVSTFINESVIIPKQTTTILRSLQPTLSETTTNTLNRTKLETTPLTPAYATATTTTPIPKHTSQISGAVNPATWSEWFYARCTVSCGHGTTTRLRHCSTGCDRDCSGRPFETVPCTASDCSVDGWWSNWSSWSACSVTCGEGSHARGRSCDNPPLSHGGLNCMGSGYETATCKDKDCPHWLQFDAITPCSVTCGTGFIQFKRNCSTGNQSDCTGSAYTEKECHLTKCF